MKKMKTMLLSMQPVIASLIISFLSEDILFNWKFAYYNDSVFKKELVNYDVLVLDDGSLSNNETKLLESFVKYNKNRKLLYTSRLDSDYINNFIDLGIEGILTKRADFKKLREAVIKISNGGKYFGEYSKYAIEDNKMQKLSNREREIFDLTRNSFKNKEIAEKLFLSIKTVEAHKENIKHKLNLKSIKDIYSIV